MWKPNFNLATDSAGIKWNDAGLKFFELSNHLSNVMSVINDNRTLADGVYAPVVINAQDYYAFGSVMPDREYAMDNSIAYRYGFNGKENDNEVLGQQDYGFRMYDSRIGKFKSVDPLSRKFPYWSPYAFAGNTPIQAIDLDGKEILFVNGHYQDNTFGRNILGSSKSGKGYWSGNFESEAKKFFKDNSPVTDANYINGSSAIGADMSGKDRFIQGHLFAKRIYKKLLLVTLKNMRILRSLPIAKVRHMEKVSHLR